MQPLPKPILVISDATGETAERVVRAGLQQFQDHLVHVHVKSHVTRPEQLATWFRVAAGKGAFVVTTLVDPEMRAAAGRLAQEHGVAHVELLGSLLGELETFLEQAPVNVPGLMHQADDAYFQRVEAIEYTVKVDDGKEPRLLRDADIVLVGVSRTGKTPLSVYLAHKGFKVANVPIVLDRPLPDALLDVDPRRVFALTIDPDTLQSIRRSRLRTMGMGKAVNYDDFDYILAELEYADRLFRSHREWPVIDVTNKAVEETAAHILSVLNDRGLLGGDGMPVRD